VKTESKRTLDSEAREPDIQHDWDFGSAVYHVDGKWGIYFLRNEKGEFVKRDSGYIDWYIQVAIEKLEKIKDDRHLINSKLIERYRWAIREGYNHQLDSALRNPHDFPRNGNTIKGVLAYIKRIEKASEEEMKQYRD